MNTRRLFETDAMDRVGQYEMCMQYQSIYNETVLQCKSTGNLEFNVPLYEQKTGHSQSHVP